MACALSSVVAHAISNSVPTNSALIGGPMRRLLLATVLILPLAVGPATAQTVTSPTVLKTALIFSNATLTGNGADTTEDALAGYTGTIQLVNVGDVVHVTARGVAAATTDTKSIRVKIAATTACSVANTTAANITWYLDCWILKTGANTQSGMFLSNNVGNNSINGINVPNVTDTSPITISMTAQNATAATANSIQVQAAFAQYFPAQ
jgi:hypothetical protein